MRKILLLFLTAILVSVVLIGCSAAKEPTSTVKDVVAENDTNDNQAEKETAVKSTATLPDRFPAEFPIPDEFTITEVDDASEGNNKHYKINFDFDPAIDMEPIFDLYKEYADKIEYTIILGGEEFFAEDVFQFGAGNPKSPSNMFVITMATVDNIYGNIDVRFVEE